MIQKVGINLSKLSEITDPNITISDSPKEILEQIPQKANELTNGFLGYGILIGLAGMLYFVLSDKTPFANFGYSDDRAMAITTGISSVFGLVLLQLGFITSFKAVALFTILFMITQIFVLLRESKE